MAILDLHVALFKIWHYGTFGWMQSSLIVTLYLYKIHKKKEKKNENTFQDDKMQSWLLRFSGMVALTANTHS